MKWREGRGAVRVLISIVDVDGPGKSEWGRPRGGRAWDVKWSLAKNVTQVGPHYSRLGVRELWPQAFSFANKVLLEHSHAHPLTYDL